MKRAFRYLWQSVGFNLLVLLGLAVVLTLGAAYSGGSAAQIDNKPGLFTTYFALFPLMSVLILFILSFNLCSVELQVAISFGARRRDFFLGVQGVLLAYALAAWGLQAVMSRIPEQLHWSNLEKWELFLGNEMGFGSYLLMIMAVLALGCLSGLVYTRSRFWSVVVICVVVIAGVAGVFLQLVIVDAMERQLWGDLPWILTVLFALALAAAELGIWRFVKGYCVR